MFTLYHQTDFGLKCLTCFLVVFIISSSWAANEKSGGQENDHVEHVALNESLPLNISNFDSVFWVNASWEAKDLGLNLSFYCSLVDVYVEPLHTIDDRGSQQEASSKSFRGEREDMYTLNARLGSDKRRRRSSEGLIRAFTYPGDSTIRYGYITEIKNETTTTEASSETGNNLAGKTPLQEPRPTFLWLRTPEEGNRIGLKEEIWQEYDAVVIDLEESCKEYEEILEIRTLRDANVYDMNMTELCLSFKDVEYMTSTVEPTPQLQELNGTNGTQGTVQTPQPASESQVSTSGHGVIREGNGKGKRSSRILKRENQMHEDEDEDQNEEYLVNDGNDINLSTSTTELNLDLNVSSTVNPPTEALSDGNHGGQKIIDTIDKVEPLLEFKVQNKVNRSRDPLGLYLTNRPRSGSLKDSSVNISAEDPDGLDKLINLGLDPILLKKHETIKIMSGALCYNLSLRLCGKEVQPISKFPGFEDLKFNTPTGIDCYNLDLDFEQLKETLENDTGVQEVFSVEVASPENDLGGFGGSYLVPVLDKVKYDKETPPKLIKNQPVEVLFQIYIESLANFHSMTMDYDMDIYLRMAWRDSRLQHPFDPFILISQESMLQKLWLPDPYFANSKYSRYHDVSSFNFVARVYPDGVVFYNVRVSFVAQNELRRVCALVAYPNDAVNFVWRENNPIELNPAIALPDLYVEKYYQDTCNGSSSTGNYSCLRAVFDLRREEGFYVAQIYIPTTITLAFSWVSVWLPVEFLEGRIGVAITVLLIVATESNGAKENLPFVSYTKAIDIWLGFIKGFVFTTLIQTLIVLGLARKAAVMERWSRKKSLCQEERDEFEDRAEYFYKAGHRLDVCCRVLYPVIFCIFLIFYFALFMKGPQDDCVHHKRVVQ